MSSKAQKLFAKYVGTRGAEHDALGRKLRGLGVRYKDLYYIWGNQAFTIHGNIPCGQFIPKSRQREAQPKRGHRLQEKRTKTRSTASMQHSDPGTGPRRAGWAPPAPAPHRKTREEFLREESDFDALSVIRRRNGGSF